MKWPFRFKVWQGSLKNRLLVSFLLLSLVPLGAASLVAYRTITDGAHEAAIREMTALAHSAAQAVNVYMNDRVGDQLVWSKMNIVLEALEVTEVRESANETLMDLVKLSGAYDAVMLLDDRGTCIVASTPLSVKENFASDPLFTNAMKDRVFIKDMYHDSRIAKIVPDSGGWTLAIATPVKIGQKVSGVLCAFLKWSVIESLVSETKVGVTGYVYVVNRDQQVIAHPSRDLYHQAVAGPKIQLRTLADALKNREPYHYYWYQNAKTKKQGHKLAGLAYPKGFGNFPGLGWQFGAAADLDEVTGFVSKIFGYVLIAGILAAALVVLLSFYLARGIAMPIAAIASEITKVGAGDLTVELPEVNRDDEVGALANAFRLMLKNLKDQTKQVLSGVTILTNTGEGISRAVSRLAETASESSEAVKKSTEIVDEVQREVRLSADKVRGVADQAGAITRSGVEAAEQTALNMGIIKEQMQRIRASVDMLGVRSQEIERIVVSVQDIADQSNLLAVNASIEAAQAGERGRGFAVVAHEIKTLANQSKKSTNNVQQFLKEITKSITAVTEATEAADKAVSSGVEHSALAGKSIRSLAGSVSASSDTVTAIEASSDVQAIGLEEISSSITGVEKAVKQNAESAKELEDAVKELHRLGSQLSVLVSRFRVE